MFNHFFNSLLRVFREKNTFSINFSKKNFLTRVYVQYKKYNKVYILLYMVQYKGHFLKSIHLTIMYLAFNLSLRVQLQPSHRYADPTLRTRRNILLNIWYFELFSVSLQANVLILNSATLQFNIIYKCLSNKKLPRILPCQNFHLPQCCEKKTSKTLI